jgi:hypothetical protein
MAEILEAEGIGVCRGTYGKQLGEGLFEFRLRHDAAEILRSLGKPTRDGPRRERILLRVFCHAHGDRMILLLGGYDKGADASRTRQQREIAEADDASPITDAAPAKVDLHMGSSPYCLP